MSLPPTSNGIMPHHYSPPAQPPLQPHQPGLFAYYHSQRNSWVTHVNNPHQTGSFDLTASFATSIPNAPHVSQGSAQSLGLSHLPFLNDQPFLDPVPPTAPSATLGGSGRHLSTNRTFQAWPTCTCALCSAHPTFWPVRFDDGWSAFAGRDAMAPSAAPPSRPSSHMNHAASFHTMAPSAAPPARSSSPANPVESLHARPSIRSAQPQQFAAVVNAGSGSWDLSPTSGGPARPSRRPGRVLSVRSARGRRTPARPLVRVEDRVEWVRHDLMKMTLLFNWSPQAEAEAHEPWG